MINVELQKTAIDLLEAQFNIKIALDCRSFDTHPSRLEEKLKPYQSKPFGPKDKILLVHMDTDYYDSLLPYGIIPINVVRIFKNLDISFGALLFVTNHFGISREFESLLVDQHPKDRPIIIETLLSSSLISKSYEMCDQISFDDIEKAGICMMNRPRSHRIALYNFLSKNSLLDKIAVSQNFNA